MLKNQSLLLQVAQYEKSVQQLSGELVSLRDNNEKYANEVNSIHVPLILFAIIMYNTDFVTFSVRIYIYTVLELSREMKIGIANGPTSISVFRSLVLKIIRGGSKNVWCVWRKI